MSTMNAEVRQSEDPSFEEIYLARQPIVTRDGGLYGFELLFRRAYSHQHADVDDGMRATTTVVSNMLSELGAERVLGQLRGFINADGQFLQSDLVELLPPRQVALEILEDTLADGPMIERCRSLRQAGFDIALDDYAGDFAAVEPILPYVSMVKIDLVQVPHERLAEVCEPLRAFNVRLIAEKVETESEFTLCADLGFDLFQGYHFARPEVMSARRSQRARSSMLRLLSLIYSDSELSEIEDEIKRHPQLGYNLLRLVNSAAGGLATKISSIKHALVMLGRRQLQVWLQLLLYTGERGERMVMSPLLQTAALRGRLMENMARFEDPHGEQFQDYAFMVGMRSLVDVLLGLPRADILEHLNLDDDVCNALLRGEGRLGRLLDIALALESDDQNESLETMLQAMRMPRSYLHRLELDAFCWANNLLAEE